MPDYTIPKNTNTNEEENPEGISVNSIASPRYDALRYPYTRENPVPPYGINQGFHINDPVIANRHYGFDRRCPRNTDIYPMANGIVVSSYFSSTYGNCLVINHGSSYDGNYTVNTLYGHGYFRLVNVGEYVTTNDIIMTVGNSGNSHGNHLHYELIIYPGILPTNSIPYDACRYPATNSNLRYYLYGPGN